MYPVDMLKVRDRTRNFYNFERRADGWPDEDASHQPRAFRDIPELHRQCPRHCFESRGIQIAMEGAVECCSGRW